MSSDVSWGYGVRVSLTYVMLLSSNFLIFLLYCLKLLKQIGRLRLMQKEQTIHIILTFEICECKCCTSNDFLDFFIMLFVFGSKGVHVDKDSFSFEICVLDIVVASIITLNKLLPTLWYKNVLFYIICDQIFWQKTENQLFYDFENRLLHIIYKELFSDRVIIYCLNHRCHLVWWKGLLLFYLVFKVHFHYLDHLLVEVFLEHNITVNIEFFVIVVFE